jgi:hypothetical protein
MEATMDNLFSIKKDCVHMKSGIYNNYFCTSIFFSKFAQLTLFFRMFSSYLVF